MRASGMFVEGDTMPRLSVAAGRSPQAVGLVPAVDLQARTTYHYALVAVNKFGIQTIGPE